MSDFKVETKSTLWDVMLSHGEYSDYDETHYYIRANDRDEAWYLFKKYWEQSDPDTYTPCLIFETEKFAPYEYKKRYDGDTKTDWDFDADYGDANDVTLQQLPVIVFSQA